MSPESSGITLSLCMEPSGIAFQTHFIISHPFPINIKHLEGGEGEGVIASYLDEMVII